MTTQELLTKMQNANTLDEAIEAQRAVLARASSFNLSAASSSDIKAEFADSKTLTRASKEMMKRVTMRSRGVCPATV